MAENDGFVMDGETEKSRTSKTLPIVDFASFILSLYSSGMVQLGKLEDPSGTSKTVDLILARHTIDMMAMLEEKTKGNLTEEEQNLLKTLLREIRLAFVEAKK